MNFANQVTNDVIQGALGHQGRIEDSRFQAAQQSARQQF